LSQLDNVFHVLKKVLKQHQVTYKQLAVHLEMSEANVKRMFSSQQCNLSRLEDICAFIQLRLTDLFLLIENEQEKISQLSIEQEQELIGNTKLFLVAVCVRDGWKFQEIIDHYQIDQYECIQLMVKLDRLKMIQLLPNNQYKMLITQDFKWINNGPLDRFIKKEVIDKFLASSFTQVNSHQLYFRGSYSQPSINHLLQKIDELTKDAAELNRKDAALPLSTRSHIGLFTAIRPWELGLFETLKR
jgi:DNA-binding Xre family transcriptional regulator